MKFLVTTDGDDWDDEEGIPRTTKFVEATTIRKAMGLPELVPTPKQIKKRDRDSWAFHRSYHRQVENRSIF